MPEPDLSGHVGGSSDVIMYGHGDLSGEPIPHPYTGPSEPSVTTPSEPYEPMPSSYESSLTPAPFTDPSQPMPDDLKELDDEDDWEEPEDRLDKADMHDEEDDDEED